MQILKKKHLLQLGCHGNVSVDVHVTTTLKCSQELFGKVAKFGALSLNGFKLFIFLVWGEGGLGLNRVKEPCAGIPIILREK